MARDDDRIETSIREAGELHAEMTLLREKTAANRSMLRLAAKAGWLTPEQIAWLEEFYPEKTRATLDEQIAAVEARSAKLREKAAKAATTPLAEVA